MEILTKIKNEIDKLKSNPGGSLKSVDVDYIVSLLSEGYSIAKDGLNRSQLAAKAPKLIEEVKQLKTTSENAKKELASIRTEYEELKELKPFYEDVKNKIIGKVKLIKSYSNDYKDAVIQEVINSNVTHFLTLRNKIISDFNNEWNQKNDTEIVNVKNNDSFVHYKHVKI